MAHASQLRLRKEGPQVTGQSEIHSKILSQKWLWWRPPMWVHDKHCGALVTHCSFLSEALQISTQKSIDSLLREDVLNPQTGQLEFALSRQCRPAGTPGQGSRPKSSHGVWLCVWKGSVRNLTESSDSGGVVLCTNELDGICSYPGAREDHYSLGTRWLWTNSRKRATRPNRHQLCFSPLCALDRGGASSAL